MAGMFSGVSAETEQGTTGFGFNRSKTKTTIVRKQGSNLTIIFLLKHLLLFLAVVAFRGVV